LKKSGQQGALTFTLVQSDPAPPGLTGNKFTIKVAQPGGAAFAGDLRAYVNMPDRTIPPNLQPTVQLDTMTGLYTVNSAFFVLAGVWRLQLTMFPVASGDAGTPVDTAAFFFCIGG
jgi:hypothetical protein